MALLAAALALALQAPPTVFTADSLTRVRPTDPPRDTVPVRLSAARNEVEAFQVVVRAGGVAISGVTAQATDFTGPGGATIARTNVDFFREHLVVVRRPSPRASEPAGPVPDPLIPFGAPAGAPFGLPRDLSQPLWVEIRVPRDAAPGDYSGLVIVTIPGMPPLAVPVTLTVWDFALPDRPSLRTNFGGLGSRLVTGHKGVKRDSPELHALERKYAEAMAAHRICPPIPASLRPKPGADGTVDPKSTHDELKSWIDELRVTGFPVPLLGDDPAGKDRDRATKHLATMHVYLKKHGWDGMAYAVLGEEPMNAKAGDEIRRRAALVREAAPGLRTFCTAPLGTLDDGTLDLRVVPWEDFDGPRADARRKGGEEVWSTTTLVKGKAETPFWQIDFPLLNYRVPAWTSRHLGIAGLHYWTSVFWPLAGNVWQNPMTYEGLNGEGMLFYPGPPAGVDGPVASMRLKAIRDGLEDYEYFVLAGDAGVDVIPWVARSWTDWDRDPVKLIDARAELARLIVAAKKK